MMNAPSKRLVWETKLGRQLSPAGFFLGVFLGFVSCCWMGRIAPALFPLVEFQRFHDFINPESQYFPTALQVQSLVFHHLPGDKIAVVIGGDSIFAGIGQDEDELWSRRLQALLGSDYRVLNLAVPGGSPTGLGQQAVEMLHRGGRRVIHVCDGRVHGFAAEANGGNAPFSYLFHDAHAREMLVPYARREVALAARHSAPSADGEDRERGQHAFTNRWLSFDDLWSVAGQEAVFTVWTARTSKHAWRPRKLWADPPPHVAAFQLNRLKVIEAVRAQCLPQAPATWTRFENQILESVPPELRSSTLAVVPRCNPDVLRHLAQEDPAVATSYDRQLRETIQHLRAAGLEAVDACRSCVSDEYMDGHHLFPSGGAKLAAEIAPLVRQLAAKLGYAPTP